VGIEASACAHNRHCIALHYLFIVRNMLRIWSIVYGDLWINIFRNRLPMSMEFIASSSGWVTFIRWVVICKAMAVDECCMCGENASDHYTNEQYRGRRFSIVITPWNGTQFALRSWTSPFRWFVSYPGFFFVCNNDFYLMWNANALDALMMMCHINWIILQYSNFIIDFLV